MQPATRSSKQPLGGISRDRRRRVLRFHVPLALASGLVFVLFLTLPRFDASAYPALDRHSSGPFPQQEEGGRMDMEMDMEEMDMDHGEDQAERMGGDS